MVIFNFQFSIFNFQLECAVLAAVVKLLLKVVIIVDYLIVNNLAVLLNRNYVGVDESAVRFQVQCLIALFYLLVQGGVNVYGIGLNQVLACLVVTL